MEGGKNVVVPILSPTSKTDRYVWTVHRIASPASPRAGEEGTTDEGDAQLTTATITDLRDVFQRGGFPGTRMHGQGGSFYIVRTLGGKSLAHVTKNGHVDIYGKTLEGNRAIMDEMLATVRRANYKCEGMTASPVKKGSARLYSGTFPFALRFSSLCDAINACQDEPQLFAFITEGNGAVQVPLVRNKDEGTLNFFATGKVTAMGVKDAALLQHVLERICAIITESYDLIANVKHDQATKKKSGATKEKSRNSKNITVTTTTTKNTKNSSLDSLDFPLMLGDDDDELKFSGVSSIESSDTSFLTMQGDFISSSPCSSIASVDDSRRASAHDSSVSTILSFSLDSKKSIWMMERHASSTHCMLQGVKPP